MEKVKTINSLLIVRIVLILHYKTNGSNYLNSVILKAEAFEPSYIFNNLIQNHCSYLKLSFLWTLQL